MPIWSAGDAARVEIRLLMADRTAQRRKAQAVLTTRDRRLMQAAEVALTRAVARGMAVHAARMGQHFGGFCEQGRRARRDIADRGEAVDACKTLRRRIWASLRRDHGHEQSRDR